MIRVNFGLNSYDFVSVNDVCRWLKALYKTIDGSFKLEVTVDVVGK